MKATIRIVTQYHENYGTDHLNQAHWKAKGSHTFELKVNSDWMFGLSSEELQTILTKIVEDESNGHEMFEYRQHEVSFSEPTKLDGATFEKLAREVFN